METRDKYEGCPEEIAQALKNGKQIRGFWWDDIEDIEECWLESYHVGLTEPFLIISDLGWFGFAKHFSLTDPRKPKKISTREDAFAWAEKNPWEIVCGRRRGYVDMTFLSCKLEDIDFPDYGPAELSVLTSKDPEEWTLLTEIEL